MAARLREHALARVDQDYREIGGRRAGDHVARVLLVAGRVGDDELASRGREEAVRDVDRDPLLALGRQAVDEQREIEFAALRADLLRIDFELGQLVVEQHVRFVEQATDQCALAVADAAARDEAQQVLGLRIVVGERGGMGARERVGRGENVCHQKYPSCFFFSIEPAESLSISRPCRSDVRVSRISCRMSSSDVASLSIAPVSG